MSKLGFSSIASFLFLYTSIAGLTGIIINIILTTNNIRIRIIQGETLQTVLREAINSSLNIESNSLILTESILVFFIISIIEVLAGIWLWERHKKGGKIGLIILPVSLSISIILNLQFLIIIHLAKIIFLAAAWKELK